MKEVFRHADSVLVGLYQSILEDAGLNTFVGNTGTQQSLVGGLVTAIFPLPMFFPTLYVLSDDDYPEAMNILRSIADSSSLAESEWRCTQCGEAVPGTFTACWKCEVAPDARFPRLP